LAELGGALVFKAEYDVQAKREVTVQDDEGQRHFVHVQSLPELAEGPE